MQIDTVEFLIPLVHAVEKEGCKPNMLHFNFAVEESEDVQDILQYFPNAHFEDVSKVVKKCIANDYLEHTSIGPNSSMRLTSKGFYAGKSKIESKNKENSKTVLLKTSDWIAKHNGLLTLSAMIIGTLGFVVALMGLF